MTPQQKRLVQETWAHVVPIADQAATLFYDRLFKLDPSLKALFTHADMPAQRAKLTAVLNEAVSGLDRLDTILPAVEALGRRHVAYGVTDQHYVTVGAALLWTLEQGLGEIWSREAEEAWTAVYGAVSGAMRGAAAAVH